MKALKGKTLALERGATYGDDFEAMRAKKLFSVVSSSGREEGMRLLMLERVDVVILSPGRAAFDAMMTSTPWLKAREHEFVVAKRPFKIDPNYIGIPKAMNKSHLLPKINEALKEIEQDGTLSEVIKQNIYGAPGMPLQ